MKKSTIVEKISFYFNLSTGENVSKAVEMLLDRVMLRMESLSFPGRMLPIKVGENGNEKSNEPIRLDEAVDKSKCNC